MKRFLVLIIMAVALSMGASAQVVLNGKTFSSATNSKTTTKKDTIITSYKYKAYGKEWPIILSSKGAAYYYAINSNGKKVRRNCPHEVSEQLASIYHTGYVYKPRKK